MTGKNAQYSSRYSETVVTHIADVYDCGTHMYMYCGAIIEKMEACACLAASKHCRGNEVQVCCGYHFNFLELIPRGTVCYSLSYTVALLFTCLVRKTYSEALRSCV